jgi:hypothetical protein
MLHTVAGMMMVRADGWRGVHGIVRDRSGLPLGGVIVQIEDETTLDFRSYVVQKDGKYRFRGLYSNVEYTLRARYRNVWGPKKTLSKFDSRKNPDVPLSVDVKKEE